MESGNTEKGKSLAGRRKPALNRRESTDVTLVQLSMYDFFTTTVGCNDAGNI